MPTSQQYYLFIASWISICLATPLLNGTSTMKNFTMNQTSDVVMERSFPSVQEFYPDINQDLTLVTWAHGVDRRRTLHNKLRDKRVMMIEADVSLGKIKYSTSAVKVPIMAHPPVRTSDISLEDFLDTILNYAKPRGIKLDIKDINVLDQTLEIIKARESKIQVPLWLNADIIRGPVDSSTQPLDANRFLTSIKNYFPGAVLSVGWTTRYGPDLSNSLVIIKEGSYTFDQVRQMRDALLAANIEQPVTFPIRAGLSTSTESQKNILWLLEQVPGSTLTLWGSFYDTVDVPALMELINAVGKERIYIDVPSGLKCQISRYRAFSSASAWIFGSTPLGRRSRLSAAAGLLAFVAYVTCATSFLPWNAGSYTIA